MLSQTLACGECDSTEVEQAPKVELTEAEIAAQKAEQRQRVEMMAKARREAQVEKKQEAKIDRERRGREELVTPEGVAQRVNQFNFYELVVDQEAPRSKSEKGWFIKFYDPECPECKKIEDQWNELYQQENENMNIGQVDCRSEFGTDLCLEYGIDAVPTMIVFPPVDLEDNHKFCKYQSNETEWKLITGRRMRQTECKLLPEGKKFNDQFADEKVLDPQ